jgi:hypothetical protein
MAYQNYQAMRVRQQISKRHILPGVLIALWCIGASVFILSYRSSTADLIDLQIGDVASKDMLAPRQFSYIS